MTVTAATKAKRPDLPRETEQFAEEVLRFVENYRDRLKELRSDVERILTDDDHGYGDFAKNRLNTLRHDERIARAGAEQLARYVSQEIEQGGLPRHMEVKLGTLSAELESAITSTQEYVQEAKLPKPQPVIVNASREINGSYPAGPPDIDRDDVPF